MSPLNPCICRQPKNKYQQKKNNNEIQTKYVILIEIDEPEMHSAATEKGAPESLQAKVNRNGLSLCDHPTERKKKTYPIDFVFVPIFVFVCRSLSFCSVYANSRPVFFVCRKTGGLFTRIYIVFKYTYRLNRSCSYWTFVYSFDVYRFHIFFCFDVSTEIICGIFLAKAIWNTYGLFLLQ